MKTFTIILNYNGKSLLKKYFSYLFASKEENNTLCLIDNASGDNSVQYIKQNYSEVKIIQNKKNYAWAEGNNIGIRHALKNDYDIIALLNNDIIVPEFWLMESMKIFENNSEVGIIGFRIVGEHERKPVSDYEQLKNQWSKMEYEEVQYVSGCIMLVKSEVFKSIGLIDSIYYKYGEEVDFQARAFKSGFKVVKSNIPVWHAVAGTSSLMPYSTAYYCIRNDLRFAIKQKSIWFVFNRFLKLVYIITYPFYKPNLDDLFLKRIMPSNYLINNMLFLVAFLWNILFLPQTLWIRSKE